MNDIVSTHRPAETTAFYSNVKCGKNTQPVKLPESQMKGDNGSQWSKEVRIELGPTNGSEGTWWEVPQECNGLTEEYEPCSCICRYNDKISEC